MPSSAGKNPLAELARRGYVSLARFAVIIGVSYPTALKLKNEGKVQTIKVGSINRVYADEVRRYLQEGNYNGSPSSFDDQDAVGDDDDYQDSDTYD